mmetsp:Transcript_11268/g.69626  ORF Transcript_11268/g.69626 Transcript_11268/m.69626 type:complete len:89 (-) Transcript_11268:2110-2376(-)
MSDRTEGGVEDPADALRAELRRLSNAVSHLERSNRELVDANAQCEDEEYVRAIQENEEVIARMRQQMERLQDEVETADAQTRTPGKQC